MVFTLVNDLGYVDREDLLVEDGGRTRGHEHKSRKMRCKKNAENFGLPQDYLTTMHFIFNM